MSYICWEYKMGDGGVFIWIGSLRSDDGDENVHHTFAVRFFAVTARLRRENA